MQTLLILLSRSSLHLPQRRCSMKVLSFEQGSIDWKNFRLSLVTASDIAILMTGGDKEIHDLYHEKVNGKERFVTTAMAAGAAMEEEAREWFFGTRKKIERPCVMHEKCNWLMASLDALHLPTMTIAEFKCPKSVPEEIEKYHGYEKAVWQIQAQLYVTGLEEAWLVLYSPLVQKKSIIKRDEAKIARLLEKGYEFYQRMLKREEPAVPKGVVKREEEEDLIALSNALKEKTARLKAIEEELAVLKEEAIRRANGFSYECNGMAVRFVEPEDRVDYKAAADNLLKGVDLSSFQKRSKPYWRVSA